MELSVEIYADAVRLLLEVAYTGTSSGRAAAQVLLSAYNGDEWQLDITDLCVLDQKHYAAAISVIRGRREMRVEPHQLIEDGSSHFSRIWDKWHHLSVKERGKTECSYCDGKGEIPADLHGSNSDETILCKRCDGKGRYWQD